MLTANLPITTRLVCIGLPVADERSETLTVVTPIYGRYGLPTTTHGPDSTGPPDSTFKVMHRYSLVQSQDLLVTLYDHDEHRLRWTSRCKRALPRMTTGTLYAEGLLQHPTRALDYPLQITGASMV